ncbi:unnamed protein product, partial [Urochloa humidicola]
MYLSCRSSMAWRGRGGGRRCRRWHCAGCGAVKAGGDDVFAQSAASSHGASLKSSCCISGTVDSGEADGDGDMHEDSAADSMQDEDVVRGGRRGGEALSAGEAGKRDRARAAVEAGVVGGAGRVR